MTELESLTTTSDEHTHKLQESYGNKLKTLESQVRLKVHAHFTTWPAKPTTLAYGHSCVANS